MRVAGGDMDDEDAAQGENLGRAEVRAANAARAVSRRAYVRSIFDKL